MSVLAFVNYIRFLNTDGTPLSYAYQNFSIGEVRIYNGIEYTFVPFAVGGGVGSKGGDRNETTLGAGNNLITVNLFAEAVQSRWLLEVKTVSLNPETYEDQSLIRSETWRVASYEMDVEKIALRLSSPLDAVRDQVPRRYLSSKLVGALPSTSTLVVT